MTRIEKYKRRALIARRTPIILPRTSSTRGSRWTDAQRETASIAQKLRWKRRKIELGLDPDTTILDDTYGGPADADLAELPEAL